MGRRIGVPLPNPLEFPLERLNPDANDNGPEMPEYLKGLIPLFRHDLIAALQRGGVDNLDLYNAAVIETDNQTRHTNYKAANIIGAIAAADMGLSNATVNMGGPVIDVDFDGLVVDEKKTRGSLMFRLAESVHTILVHEKLRDHLLKEGFHKLEFLDPKECAL